ncbi:hypothetical protein [Fusobacterium sp.]|uniref:hypothetical protein n=1 Tax=Fusobacterium sp. TaxID=68766 RepID=UPI00290323E6|nr:hypothetical protein [Fusobacterium sp.]MDU1912532.1 hypothetical protein [Fusobacterium sp.]
MLNKIDIFRLLKEEYIDKIHRIKEKDILDFMNRNYMEFKKIMKLEIFYLCVRGENQFFIADSKNSLKDIIKEDRENSGGITDIKVLKKYK